MKESGWGTSVFKTSLQFIDGYSWRTTEKPSDDNVVVLSSVAELNELNHKVKELMPRDGRVVIDSISDLLIQAESESVFKFIQSFVGLARERKSTVIIVLEEGVHTSDTVSMLEYLCDGVINMKMRGTKRFVRIKKMFSTSHPLAWIEYHIGDGIFIKISHIFKTANYPFDGHNHPKE
jgi:KaiC/GvpD/RAD55 family RecA-like ATPase